MSESPVVARNTVERSASAAVFGGAVLEARSIVKRFGSVEALRGANLTLHAGECLGLVGDNGAGKSTLLKVLSGALTPDGGEIAVDGLPVHLKSPQDARSAGIETVYQDLAVAPTLDAPTNIFLGREAVLYGLLGRLGFLDRAYMRRRAGELIARLNVPLASLDEPISTFSGGQRQGVVLARALNWEQRILMLDEPTAALGPRQRTQVVDLIHDLRRERPMLSMVIVSHDLPHLLQTVTRVNVMRQGKVVADFGVADATEHILVAAIAGVT